MNYKIVDGIDESGKPCKFKLEIPEGKKEKNMKKEGNYITEAARLRFKKWLVVKGLTVNKFSKGCGCSRQYIEQILAGKKKITNSVREHFKKGGYALL